MKRKIEFIDCVEELDSNDYHYVDLIKDFPDPITVPFTFNLSDTRLNDLPVDYSDEVKRFEVLDYLQASTSIILNFIDNIKDIEKFKDHNSYVYEVYHYIRSPWELLPDFPNYITFDYIDIINHFNFHIDEEEIMIHLYKLCSTNNPLRRSDRLFELFKKVFKWFSFDKSWIALFGMRYLSYYLNPTPSSSPSPFLPPSFLPPPSIIEKNLITNVKIIFDTIFYNYQKKSYALFENLDEDVCDYILEKRFDWDPRFLVENFLFPPSIYRKIEKYATMIIQNDYPNNDKVYTNDFEIYKVFKNKVKNWCLSKITNEDILIDIKRSSI